MKYLLSCCLHLLMMALAALPVRAQSSLSGELQQGTAPASGLMVELMPGSILTTSDPTGHYRFEGLEDGVYAIRVYGEERVLAQDTVRIAGADVVRDLVLILPEFEISSVEIYDELGGAEWLRSVDGARIFCGRKTELIRIDHLDANLSVNNARQVFNRVAGLNIWESDGGGLQLGIGGRGLSPNRTSNFNTRQNGYDIAADALGYPESYYTPPMEAVERIEVVRGAASLQYGTQFGGMVNFVMQDGPEDQAVQATSRLTMGSFGLVNLFNSFGLNKGKVKAYGLWQLKSGDGWRDNSGFGQGTLYGRVKVQVSPRLEIGAEITRMDYQAQQAGGLTDAMFEQNPRQSIRDRNWFRVRWNLAAVTANLRLNERTRVDIRTFGLHAQRDALGFLGGINRVDPMGERNLITGTFSNFGNETRLLHKYSLRERPAAFLLGGRYYQGYTVSRQGNASAGSEPEFELLNPEQPEQSSYTFPSRNLAVFAENLIPLTSQLSLSPGARFEYIHTASDGVFQERAYDLAGNLIYANEVADQRELSRAFVLGGLGVAYRFQEQLEAYGNLSQNYRAINFNDLRVVNPNFKIDENLKDERGYNADLGLRGRLGSWLDFDLSLFYLSYKDRIGQVLMVDSTFNYYRYRTNIADSRNLGVEWYAEANLSQLIRQQAARHQFSVFTNVAFIDARYIDSDEPAFDGKRVEQAPPFTAKAGLSYRYGRLRASCQWAYTAAHFTDATNAIRTPNAVEGLIPAYDVMDLAASYSWKYFKLEAGMNNVLNRQYFTRRASGYPGPGIIPADGRSAYLTLQIQM